MCFFSDLQSSRPFLLTGGMAEKRGAHRLGARREHRHEGGPQPDHQAGAALRLGELHLHGCQHRGQEEEPVGHRGSLW